MPPPTDQTAPATPETIPYPFCGVFSEISTKTVGFGATKRKEKVKKLWLLERDPEGSTSIRPINSEYLPAGTPKSVDLAKIIQAFYPEPEIYMTKVLPKMQELEGMVDEADEHREKGEQLSAEFAYQSALEVDEDHVRANFGLGLTYLDMGDTERAKHTFDKLVSLDSAFSPEHKHLFNEFGISLRKSKMLDESLEYYAKALALQDTDEHLLFNMSRVHFEKKDFGQAYVHAKLALKANPQFELASKLMKAAVKEDPEAKNAILTQPMEVGAISA